MRPEIEVKIRTSSATEVDLERSNITDDEMVEIAAAIALRPNVEKVYLSYNQIGDKGAQAIEKEFAQLSKLVDLDVQFNQIGKTGIDALIRLEKSHRPRLEISYGGNAVTDTIEMHNMQHNNNTTPRR